MEKKPSCSTFMTKFSLLCELLPFYGHLPLWRYLLFNLSLQTKRVWIVNESAFRQRAKDMTMSIIKYEGVFDEQYKQYLSDPEILLNNKISIQLESKFDCFELFSNFLLDCKEAGKFPIFNQICFFDYNYQTSFIASELYYLLKQMKDNQEKYITKNCGIFSSDNLITSKSFDQSFEELTNGENVLFYKAIYIEY